MNDEDRINQEDELLHDWFKQSAVEPKAELKENILKQVRVNQEIFEYRPVISKNMWLLIFGSFLSTLVYAFIYMNRSALSSRIDFKQLDFQFFERWGEQLQRHFYAVQFHLPEIPFTLTAALGALTVVGIYFIVSYKKRFFHTKG